MSFFCGVDGDGHFFGIALILPFHRVGRMDERSCPLCLVWHGWFTALSGTGDRLPWAVEDEALARNQGSCSWLICKC